MTENFKQLIQYANTQLQPSTNKPPKRKEQLSNMHGPAENIPLSTQQPVVNLEAVLV